MEEEEGEEEEADKDRFIVRLGRPDPLTNKIMRSRCRM